MKVEKKQSCNEIERNKAAWAKIKVNLLTSVVEKLLLFVS